MQCPTCRHENPPQAKFCLECGARMVLSCAKCRAELPPSAKFCLECGERVAQPTASPASHFSAPESYTPKHLAERILTSKAALEGERKQVTVLFADLANSTALAERIGPEAMHDLLNELFELALGEVHRYEGTVNQFLGDGFMALFGAPIAHEDHARRALLAALGLQRSLHERGDRLLGETLALRMAVNTGYVVVGAIGDNLRMDYTAVGDTTNLAARLQQLAEPGTVLMGDTTYRLVRDEFRVESLGTLSIKGKTEPVSAHRVLGTGPRRSPLAIRAERNLSRFVGRERELTTLLDVLVAAERGQGHVVGIVGEPGLGKSRLLHELRAAVADRRVTYLEARCMSYGSAVPYLPLLDVVRDNCGIADADAPDVIAAKVHASLVELDMKATETAPYVLRILGVKEGAERIATSSAEAIKEGTFETLRQMTLRGARRRPMILAVEDLHWIDRTSEQYLAELVESLAGSPVLLVTTYRPGYQPAWLDKSYATQLALRALAPADDAALVRSVLVDAEIDAPMMQTIVEHGEGNPFFIEELARAVVEHGASQQVVPDTIQGVLMARIDRLPPTAKRLLQTAAVLGRDVPRRVLAEVWDEPANLDAELRALKRAEFIYTESRAEDETYVFKHVLTQEVAYASLLTSRRQALHAAAGRVLEALYADRLEPVYDRLAHHWARSGDAAKAVEYLSRLGRNAAESGAHTEAVSAFAEALEHAERLPAESREARHFELLLHDALSLFRLGRRTEIVDLLGKSSDRLTRLGEPSVAGEYYACLARTYAFLGDRQRAQTCGLRALEEGRRAANAATMAEAHHVLGMEALFVGRLNDCIEHCREAIRLFGDTAGSLFANPRYVLCLVCVQTGDFAMAAQAATQQDALSESSGSRRLRANAAESRAWIHAHRGEPDAAIEAATRGLALAPDAFYTAIITGAFGHAHLVNGDAARAVEVLESAVAQANRVRSRQVQAWFRTLLGDAFLVAGRIGDAESEFRNALDLSREIDYPFGRGRAMRGLGRVARAQGRLDEARQELAEALKTFESMGASFEIAQTCLDLAPLLHREGDQAARELLRRARTLFVESDVPIHVERLDRLARELCVSLS